MKTRRDFLQQSSAFLLLPFTVASTKELRADVAIIGGGLGGVAASLAALRNGQRVILTEETDWIGGQTTSQIVPPDEHRWIESFGGTASYRRYRTAIRDYYRHHYPLTETARATLSLNPGNGSVSRICHEPRVSVAVLEAMLAPYVSSGRLIVLLKHQPVAADVQGNTVRAVTVKSLENGVVRTIHAPYFLDATELGDLLPLTKTEYVTGFESKQQTGELHAPEKAQPLNMQAITWCFAMEHRAGEDHTIDRPDDYPFWRNYIPKLDTPWPGKFLSWEQSHPHTLKPRVGSIDPEGKGLPPNVQNFWTYRRIIDQKNFAPGTFTADTTIVNWPMNDYFLGPIIEVSEAEAAKHLRGAKQLSLSWLYWLQTEAPRPDGGIGWKGLRLRPDITSTEDGLAKYPYIRESRRIQAEFTVLEQHVGTEARTAMLKQKPEDVTAETFADSVGVGSYRIDLHMSTGGNNYIDVSSLPFQIPLGALIPKRVENLLPACKNLGVTHITNGCYRLHPVEWNIGEAAGALAAHANQIKQTPRSIRNTPKLLAEFQAKLQQQGVEIAWPKLRPV
ncbi:MAG: FAD-dependent oxidoreductase [Blastocatellia bacterium]|nr:FAD-dependent oxidoreductase [Blastocatellia bacterium]